MGLPVAFLTIAAAVVRAFAATADQQRFLEFHITGAAAAVTTHPSHEGRVPLLCTGNVCRGRAGQGRDLVHIPEALHDGEVTLALVPLSLVQYGL